jgi:metallo-beta-lactamase family protein
VPAHEIDAVVVTHAHLDHTGWIPRLVKEGFSGPIYATPSTIDLCGIILPDSGHLQEEDAAYHNKIKSSKHDPALPLYTMQEALDSIKLFRPVDFEQSVELSPELSFRYVRAAHILGSSMVELTVKQDGSSRRMLFSGDIGRIRNTQVSPGRVVRSGPYEGEDADIVVMESTYGNREHPKTDPRPEMARLIRGTVKRGGCVVIPAFAVERTQKLVFMLKQMMENNEIPKLPVHCDSPMAIKAVEVFLNHAEEFSEETKGLIAQYGSPLEWPNFYFDTTQEQSKRINNSNYPQIIISSSGMATGGRIQHHLAQRLPDPKNLVLFIGFQAPGTRGRQIKDGEKQVKIFGQIIDVRAQVATLEQFSDHADTSELLEWLHTFKKAPAQTWLVHGEPDAAKKLREAIIQEMRWNVNIAQWMQKVPVG